MTWTYQQADMAPWVFGFCLPLYAVLAVFAFTWPDPWRWAWRKINRHSKRPKQKP